MAFLRRNQYGRMWVIFIYCILSCLADNTYTHHSTVAAKTFTFYIFSAFTIIEYTLFTVFIYLSLKDKVFRTVVTICSILFFIISIFHLLTERPDVESFDSVSASLEASLIIVYSIFYLYEQIKDPNVFYVYYSKQFWIIIAFLIYLSSTLFLFIYAATFTRQEHKNYWGINNISDIIKNILFTISFIMKRDKKQTNPMESLYMDM